MKMSIMTYIGFAEDNLCANLKGDVPMNSMISFGSRNGGKLYGCLLTLIDMVQEKQKLLSEELGSFSAMSRAKEFSTVKLCSCRGSGHTSAIAKVIQDRFDKVVLVTYNLQMGNLFLNQYPHLKDKIILCSPKSLTKLLGVSGYEAVIVDCCSLFFQSQIDEVYNITMLSMKSPLYLFME